MFQCLAHRRPAPEVMDSEEIERDALEGALKGLMRMNAVGNGVGIFWPTLHGLLEQRGRAAAPLRVLDVGCGGGDLACKLTRRARKAGFEMQVDGCDRSVVAVEMAREVNERAGVAGQFFVLDVESDPMPEGYDVLFTSLFLHHLTEDAARNLLRGMATAAKSMVLVSDLIRSRFGLFLVYLATRTLTQSPVVHTDGVTSLRAAYSLEEIGTLLEDIELGDGKLERRWPERFLWTYRSD